MMPPIVVWAELIGIAAALFLPFYDCYLLRDRLNLAYTGFSTLGGLVMPLLILAVPFGFVYSFCLHELYFPVIGAGFRLYQAHSASMASTRVGRQR